MKKRKPRGSFTDPDVDREYQRFKKEFGRRLKLKHQSLDEDALKKFRDKMGYRDVTIWYWEKGTNETKLFYVYKFCKEFNIDIAELLFDKKKEYAYNNAVQIISDTRAKYNKTTHKMLKEIVESCANDPEIMKILHQILKKMK